MFNNKEHIAHMLKEILRFIGKVFNFNECSPPVHKFPYSISHILR